MESTEPRFEVLRPLGEGATSRVDLVRLSEAFDGLPAGTELARKTLFAAPEREPSAREAFLAEAQAAAAVRAPSLVRQLYHGQRDGRPYLLMQYVPGRTVQEILEQDGPLPEPRLRALGADIAQALAALHAAGVVHGDVKPENMRLDEDGRAVLLDLGFARRSHDPLAQSPRPEAGSLAYLSPERVRGEPAGFPADVFALGIVLYELATGLHPYGHNSAHTSRLGRISTSSAIPQRSIELPGADELLAAIDAARFAPPSRFVPSLSPFLDRLLAESLARAPSDRPKADALATRLMEGEHGAWWRARIDPTSPLESQDSSPWPLVGREVELATLQKIYLGLASKGPRMGVVWLVGPAGSGKWRLMTTFAERVRKSATPPLLLDARWNESDEGRPAGAALAWLNRWLGVPRGRAPLEREAARLTEFLGSASARPLLGALDPKQSGSIDRSIPAELARWLAKLSEERSVLVFLDNLHKAGAVTLGALSTLLELLRGAPILFVLSTREDLSGAESATLERLRERLERGAAEGGASFARLELPPLDQTAVGELVERLFHDSAPLLRLTEVLTKKSSGNPGFLIEILRELEARGGIRPFSDEDPRLVLTVEPDAMPMPRSLDRLIQERLAALEAGERIWLERLSIVGGRLEPEFLLRAFPPTKRGEIDEVLGRLTRKGWLVPAADRYRFERPALREALYRSLSEPRRRRLHAAAAQGLTQDTEDLEESYQRAFHLHAAREDAELLDCVRTILHPLRRRSSAQRLSTLARWALEALEHLTDMEGREKLRLEFLEDAADAADRLGRREDQRVLLDHLANFELDPEAHPAEAARLYLLHARYAASTGQLGLARGWLKTATTFAELSKDRWLLSQALRRLAQIQAQIGEFSEARALAKKSLRRAQGENQEALSHLALAHTEVLEDKIDDALARIEAAFEALRKTREPRAGVLAYAELLRGRVWRSVGLPRRSMEAIQRAVLLARRAGERRLEAEALARRGGLLLDLGEPRRAAAELRNALLLSDEIEDRRGQVLSTVMLGLLEVERGAAQARSSLERARDRAVEIAFYRAEALAIALLARLQNANGEREEADSGSARAQGLLERHGAELSDRIVIAATRAMLLGANGRKGEAKRILDELAKRIHTSQRRLRNAELRNAQKVYAKNLLDAALTAEGPVLPRGA